MTSELRLFGLAEQGSIPCTSVGLIALFAVATMRYINLLQADRLTKQGGDFMGKMTHLKCELIFHVKLFGLALVETLWAIEANIVAGALPAGVHLS